MRGIKDDQNLMFLTVNVEERIAEDHPIRKIKDIADKALQKLNPEFTSIYSTTGRPSIPPEVLLKSAILMIIHSIRSERLFCETLGWNLMYQWFLDWNYEKTPFDHSTFSQNKERLLENDIARKFFNEVLKIAREKDLLSDEHFSVDGTLIEAWASQKSFKPLTSDNDKKNPPSSGNNSWKDFKGEKRSNKTHRSTTDPEARLMKKSSGQEAKLSYTANVLMENRNALCVDIDINSATNRAERDSAKKMLNRLRRKKIHPKSTGADRGYHTSDFVRFLREKKIAPHIAVKKKWKILGLDGRTLRTETYKVSQVIRKRVEEINGWLKTVGPFRKTRYIGSVYNQHWVYLSGLAYNLIRMGNLLPIEA
jgi:transposase